MGRFSRWQLLALAAVVPLIQIVALALSSSDYTYFIDEFYYVACSKHLALGYVDHPPLAPWLLAFTRLFLGDSPAGIRLLPFLAAGATVWCTGRLVEEMGGGRFATILATLAFGLSPVFVGMTGFFSMNAFEPLIWTLLMLRLVRMAKTGNSRLWLAAGALIGIGFENKHTIVPYVAALVVGIAGAWAIQRKAGRGVAPPPFSVLWNLRSGWLWAGAGVAVALAVPNVLWQMMNGWPSIEFYRNAQTLKNISTPPLQSLATQVLAMNPLAFPVWLAGLAFLLFARDARPLRFVGLLFLALLAMHVASGTSRPDRMMAAYPILMAAGGVVLERVVHRPVARAAAVSVVAVSGLALAMMFLPLLPPAVEARYVAFLGTNIKAERGKTSPIPQLLADRTGWRSFIDDVVRVYGSLPPEDRTRAIIYVPDYGHAGAIDLWGPQAGLPRVIASQNTYWHWSNGHTNSDVLIAVGAREADLKKVYRQVTRVDTVQCDYCMSWRDHMPIFVARDPLVPLDSVWARTRFYE
jgi:4-amino-4-deoxy-L-arabinose transferase-like glycosyltransferase